LATSEFKGEGLRPYVVYRDLGAKEATGGLVDAHVNGRGRPFDENAVSKRHFHDVKFQMVYVLKGWVRSEFEGHGEHLMKEGSCWLQPPRIKHTVLGFSDDLEILEVIIPANYDTINLNEPPKGTPDPAGGAPHAR
jgi:quercetin dioxygenase-like cupin family protein